MYLIGLCTLNYDVVSDTEMDTHCVPMIISSQNLNNVKLYSWQSNKLIAWEYRKCCEFLYRPTYFYFLFLREPIRFLPCSIQVLFCSYHKVVQIGTNISSFNWFYNTQGTPLLRAVYCLSATTPNSARYQKFHVYRHAKGIPSMTHDIISSTFATEIVMSNPISITPGQF